MTTPKAVKGLPSLELLHELLSYNEYTGQLVWKSGPKVGQEAGCISISKRGYCRRLVRVKGVLYLSHRIAWKMKTGEDPPKCIDHKDRDALNNASHNLRDGDDINPRNQSLRSTNTSGVNGVYWDKRANKWMAAVSINGKQKFLGYFAPEDKDLAAMETMEARVELGYDPSHGRDGSKSRNGVFTLPRHVIP